MHRAGFLSSLVVAAVFLDGPARAAVIVVDRDRVQCPDAGFTSIQAAVDAAAPGDTVPENRPGLCEKNQ